MSRKKAVILLSILCLNPTAHAETVELEAITVEATKEGKPYLENSESVSILDNNDLPATGRENNLEIINAVPNVQVNRGGESFSIRGISNTGVTGYQMDNLSSIVIDDLFQTDLATQAGSFHLWDLQRIEVLRGAQSTSQGINSLAGMILLNHNRPVNSTEGAARFGLGNYGYWNLSALTNNVLVQNKLAVRVTYDKEQTDGFVTNVYNGNDKFGSWNRDRASLGLLYSISPEDTILLNAKFHRNGQGGNYVQGSDPFRFEVNEDVDYGSTTKNYQSTLEYTKTISPSLQNKAVLGYSKSDQSASYDGDGTPQPTAGIRLEEHNDHFVSFENRLLYKGDRFSNLLGLHIHNFKLDDNHNFNLLYPIGGTTSTPIALLQDVERTRRTYSIFDSLTYHLDKQNAIVAGVRVEHVDASYGTNVNASRTQDLGAGNAAIDAYLTQVSGAYKGNQSSTVLLPKAGYEITNENHHIGLTYTRGYRTAGVSINRRRATAVEYDPEFTNNYELSYKYQANDYQIAANTYYIDWRDQQVQAQLSGDFFDTQVQNAARSAVYGAEVEGRIPVRTRDRLALGVGYTDTEFKEFTVRGADLSGNEFPFASHWTGRLSYELIVSDPLKFLTVLRYVSDSYSNAENTRRSDAQFYTNINAIYSLGEWLFEAYVNNVFNGEYRLLDGTPTSTTTPYQTPYHRVSTPREYGARVIYYW